MACTFQATIGGKFAPLIGLSDEDMDMDIMITTYNTAVTDAASEILGKERRRKKPWVTKDVPAYRIRISACFTCAYKSYLTHVISPRAG